MTSAAQDRLVLCSKSTWDPAIRREHALAGLAADAGIGVDFVPRPLDVRALRNRSWWSGLRARPATKTARAGVAIVPSSVVLPGHRDRLAELTSAALLRRTLNAIPGIASATVVATVPWQWPAVARVSAARRVFDCADDWTLQIPSRRERIRQLFDRIDAEADAVIVVNPEMADAFPRSRPAVVRNGVADELLSEPTPPPGRRRMVWAGTLSERFDARLAGAVLQAAPDWTLDLYGQCQYPGRGDRPGAELTWLLSGFEGRVRHHGVVPRAELAAAIDGGDVTVIFNRAGFTRGQDSMKLYDYSARGRPILTTRFANTVGDEAPPHLRLADTPEEIAAALAECLDEPAEWALERRRWAESQRWERRWPEWSAALFGQAATAFSAA